MFTLTYLFLNFQCRLRFHLLYYDVLSAFNPVLTLLCSLPSGSICLPSPLLPLTLPSPSKMKPTSLSATRSPTSPMMFPWTNPTTGFHLITSTGPVSAPDCPPSSLSWWLASSSPDVTSGGADNASPMLGTPSSSTPLLLAPLATSALLPVFNLACTLGPLRLQATPPSTRLALLPTPSPASLRLPPPVASRTVPHHMRGLLLSPSTPLVTPGIFPSRTSLPQPSPSLIGYRRLPRPPTADSSPSPVKQKPPPSMADSDCIRPAHSIRDYNRRYFTGLLLRALSIIYM